MLKRNFAGFLKILEIFSVVPIDDKTLVKNTNGSMLGSTFNAHAVIPSRLALMKIEGDSTIQKRI